MLPVPVTMPEPNKMLPPEILAVVVIVLVAEISPAVKMLPPVTLAAALINPGVRRLPPAMLPVTFKLATLPVMDKFPPSVKLPPMLALLV